MLWHVVPADIAIDPALDPDVPSAYLRSALCPGSHCSTNICQIQGLVCCQCNSPIVPPGYSFVEVCLCCPRVSECLWAALFTNMKSISPLGIRSPESTCDGIPHFLVTRAPIFGISSNSKITSARLIQTANTHVRTYHFNLCVTVTCCMTCVHLTSKTWKIWRD